MNIVLWILQVLIALHTLMGVVWKFTNSEQAAGALSALPHGVWLGLGVIELLCAVGLVLPALRKPLGKWVPLAAAFIVAEMLLFTAVHVATGAADKGPVVYWLVVAAVCAFVGWGRWKLRPL